MFIKRKERRNGTAPLPGAPESFHCAGDNIFCKSHLSLSFFVKTRPFYQDGFEWFSCRDILSKIYSDIADYEKIRLRNSKKGRIFLKIAKTNIKMVWIND